MPLTSSIYRMAPSDSYITKDEAELRLRAKVRRLVEQHGQAEVLRRIRSWPAEGREVEERKAWLVLTVYAAERRGAGTV